MFLALKNVHIRNYGENLAKTCFVSLNQINRVKQHENEDIKVLLT